METLFTEIKDNKVLRVIVVDPKDAPEEAKGENFCNKLLGGDWKQTSYNGNMRNFFAEIGYIYDKEKDIFIPSQSK